MFLKKKTQGKLEGKGLDTQGYAKNIYSSDAYFERLSIVTSSLSHRLLPKNTKYVKIKPLCNIALNTKTLLRHLLLCI